MDLTITDTVVLGLPDSYSAPPLLVASRFALARAEGWTRAEKAVNGAATYANDTVMQCMVDTLYINADMGSSMLSANSLDDFGSTHRYVPPDRSMR